MSKAQLQVNNTKLSELITTLQSKDLGGNNKPEKKAFAECTWAEVSEICKAGLASEYWQIGDIKPMVDGDTSTQLHIIGFDHDDVNDPFTYGREKAGITLEHVFVPNLSNAMYTLNVKVSWYSTDNDQHCLVRRNSLPSYLANSVPEELRNVIVPVIKDFYYTSQGANSTIVDNLFVLSANEIFGTYTSGRGSEGTQYAYYAAGNEKIKRLATTGAAVNWWTRSFEYSGDNGFMVVNSAGTKTWSGKSASNYIIPCMCI